MGTDLSKILDECILRVRNGESIESCFAEYPKVQEQLEPLLQTGLSITTTPKAAPSEDFRTLSKIRLMVRLRQEAGQAKVKSERETSLLDELAIGWGRLLDGIAGMRRVAIPVTIAIILALVASSFLPSASNIVSPPPALASRGTVSILSGSVEVQSPDATGWQPGSDGMTLAVGTRVRTSPNAHALLTFFEGSTIKLDPGTDVEIQQVEYTEEHSTTIVLKQWMGRTWSRVTKMADAGSHYSIETPSAVAIVRGTLFTTEVAETGATRVATTEGLVSVVAEGKEVQLPASQQTEVETGASPSPPAATSTDGNQLVITIDAPAVGSVQDSTGSSTGVLPSGLGFNQISGSQSSSPVGGTQVITIPKPTSGEYTIVLRYVADGKANFNLAGKSEGGAIYQFTGAHEAKQGSAWVMRVNVNVEDGLLSYSSVSQIEPLRGKGPEKIVEIKTAGGSITPAEPQGN
ncbi:MAG: FecR domain-containing protein, partial [Chloroflexi bacterium]|nr:FecR domain-containing protein [Chloroflexota bacterium]